MDVEGGRSVVRGGGRGPQFQRNNREMGFDDNDEYREYEEEMRVQHVEYDANDGSHFDEWLQERELKKIRGDNWNSIYNPMYVKSDLLFVCFFSFSFVFDCNR
jgi:hypothetical protein